MKLEFHVDIDYTQDGISVHQSLQSGDIKKLAHKSAVLLQQLESEFVVGVSRVKYVWVFVLTPEKTVEDGKMLNYMKTLDCDSVSDYAGECEILEMLNKFNKRYGND